MRLGSFTRVLPQRFFSHPASVHLDREARIVLESLKALRRSIWLRLSSKVFNMNLDRGMRNVTAWLETRIQRMLQYASPPCVTISMGQREIRVVVFQGRRVVSWGTGVFEDGEVATSSEADERQNRQLGCLSRLLKSLGVRRGRVVADIPFHSAIVRQFQLPATGKRYLDQVIAAEVQDRTPFSPSEVDHRWRARGNGAGYDVVSVSVPKGTIDDHVRMLTRAGARPHVVCSKAMALVHAAGVQDAVLVHGEGAQVAIVLVRNKVPVVMKMVNLVNGSNAAAQARLVSTAVEETASYEQQPTDENDNDRLPVMLSGQECADRAWVEAVRQSTHREVIPFESSLEHPPYFFPWEYAANLGLALAGRTERGAWRKARRDGTPPSNLLSKRHSPTGFPVWSVGLFLAFVMLAVAAPAAKTQLDEKTVVQNELSAQLARLERVERQQRLALNSERAGLQEAEAEAQFAELLASRLIGLRQESEALQNQLDTLTRGALPVNVALTGLSLEGRDFHLTGTAPTYLDSLQYTAALRDTGLFADVSLGEASASGSATTGREEVVFQVRASLASPPEVEDNDESSLAQRVPDAPIRLPVSTP